MLKTSSRRLFLLFWFCLIALNCAGRAQARECRNDPPPAGSIQQRWLGLDGSDGPLGCVLSPIADAPGGHGRIVQFEHGSAVYAPDQGAGMVVAVYQQDDNLIVNWGDTAPFDYDFFLIHVEKNGQYFDQFKADHFVERTRGFFAIHLDQAGSYSIIVEGCDAETALGVHVSDKCRQSWTPPATATFTPLAKHVAIGMLPDVPLPTTPGDQPYQIPLGDPRQKGVGAQAFQARALAVAQYNACRSRPQQLASEAYQNDEEDFVTAALGKLALGHAFCADKQLRYAVDLDLHAEVNDAIRHQSITTDAGTTSDKAGCKRNGEYDVMLRGYITMLGRFSNQLDPDVRYHISQLLNKRGGFDKGDLSPCVGTPETENHLLQMETSRYLTNQMLEAGLIEGLFSMNWDVRRVSQYDNDKNGMTAWMLTHLQSFLKNDFLEYNGRPYQYYTDASLMNLYDFSTDPKMRTAAQMVLDFVSAKYVVSSDSGRRSVPYRRRVSHYSGNLLDDMSDPQKDRIMMLTGQTDILQETAHPGFASYASRDMFQAAAISSYRLPAALALLVTEPTQHQWFQRFHGDGVEIYAGDRNFTIAAGGYWMGSPYATNVGPFSFEGADDQAVALPTILLPAQHGSLIDHFVRIDGFGANVTSEDDNRRKRINTCVAPGFACGYHPSWPANYTTAAKPECWSKQPGTQAGSTWVFIDRSSTGCKNDQTSGFFVGLFSAPAPEDSYGFFEVRGKAPGLTFATFKQGVLANNAKRSFSPDGENLYVTSDNRQIRFVITPKDNNKYLWGILHTGTPVDDGLDGDIGHWPLAQGDIVNAARDGLVRITNPFLKLNIVLDMRDAANPKRTEDVPAPAPALQRVPLPAPPIQRVLAAPTDLKLLRKGPNSISLTWDPTADASWYTVEHRVGLYVDLDAGGTPWKATTEHLPANARELVDNGIPALTGTKLHQMFRVCAGRGDESTCSKGVAE